MVVDAIPPHVTAYVGGENDLDCCLYALWRDDQLLVLQAPPVLSAHEDPSTFDTASRERSTSDFCFGLEKIAALVHKLDFSRANWAYLTTRTDGSFNVIYKNKPLHPMISPGNLLAPLVEESEIITTKFISCEQRQGLWNGTEVDIMIGWNDQWMKLVEREIEGHRCLRGLDLTFEVLGHVTRDGQVIGIMTESATGRMVEYPDRAAVYDAITKVQSRGLLYSVQESNIMIADGKVRLLSLASIRKMRSGEGSAAEANRFHWDALRKLFEKLFQYPNFMPPPQCIRQQTVKILAPVPPLYKPPATNLATHPLFKIFVFASASSSSARKGTARQPITSRALEHYHTSHAQQHAQRSVTYRRHDMTPYTRHAPRSRHHPPSVGLLLRYPSSDASSETDSCVSLSL
ncbi:hypothetical protein AB1N83_003763 [Pleurotus pulmonarius]